MALKLTVGVSRKVGQPNYGSLGALCQLECELDVTLLLHEREQFQQRVEQAYSACSQAVEAELARLRRPPGDAAGEVAPVNNLAEASTSGAPDGTHLPTAPGGNGSSQSSVAKRPQNPHGDNGRLAARTPAGRRLATPAQLQALRRLAERQEVDLEGLLAEGFELDTVEQLSVAEASQLIGLLRARPQPAARRA